MASAVNSVFRALGSEPLNWLGRRSLVMRSIVAFAVIPAVTWLAFESHLNLTATTLLQLLAVLAIALRVGFWPAAIASLFANLLLNYYFVPPIFSLYIADPQNWIAVGVFELSALLVSRLSTQAQDQAARAISREREAERLYELSLGLLLPNKEEAFGLRIVLLIERVFGIETVVLLDGLDGQIYKTRDDNVADLESETRAAYLGGLTESANWIRVLSGDSQCLGALGLRGSTLTPLTMDALASLVAIAMERARSLEKKAQADAERKTEQLRTTVLDALAHEYKTPLTALRAAASGLMEIGKLSSLQFELVSLIDSEIGRLSSLTTRLLRMSRLDNAEIKLRPELVDPNELVRSVLTNMRDSLIGHEIRVENLDFDAFIKVDQELVGMALTQFIDNALKYSDPASPITVSISAVPTEVRLSVNNYGPLIPPEERGRIFQRFYRGSFASNKPTGSGIGLSISRKVADAHHGRVWVISGRDCGNTFSLALPRHGEERP